jgi:Uma2 family endonuclease
MADGDETPLEGRAMSAEAISNWMHIPQGEWTADDLDRVPEEVGRCEVLDGVLIVMSPQRNFHARVMMRLAAALDAAAPDGWEATMEMTVRLGKKNRPEPDVLVVPIRDEDDYNRTWYWPIEVLLAVEIISPDSEERDREIKPEKYARAGIPHYWLIEYEKNAPIVNVFELDTERRCYVKTAVERKQLVLDKPFPMTIDVDQLYRQGRP